MQMRENFYGFERLNKMKLLAYFSINSFAGATSMLWLKVVLSWTTV